jgi:hypothetical protein
LNSSRASPNLPPSKAALPWVHRSSADAVVVPPPPVVPLVSIAASRASSAAIRSSLLCL